MSITAPAPSFPPPTFPAPSFPAPVPAQIAAPFAKATPAATQDWQDAIRAAPALQAPALHSPAISTPAAERTTAPEHDPEHDPEHGPKPSGAPTALTSLWNAIRGITPPVKTPEPVPKPAPSPAIFGTTRAPTAGFADDGGQAGRFMTPVSGRTTGSTTPEKTAPLFSQLRAPASKVTPPLTPQDWGATPRQAPGLHAPVAQTSTPTPSTPAKTTPPARMPPPALPPLRQVLSLATQILGQVAPQAASQAAPTQGTTPRTPQDWGATPRQAPDLYAPAKTLDIPLDRTVAPVPSTPLYAPINSVVDAQRPGKLIGSSLNTAVPLGTDSPILPGGKLVIKAANIDTTTPGRITSPQIDIVATDRAGGAQGHIRVNRDTNTATGSIHLGDGRRDLVFTGAINPVNRAAGAIQITGVSDDIGLRIVLTNPGAASGVQSERVELLTTPGGGGFVRNGPNLRKPVEAYVFATRSKTPGSAATTGAEGVGIRFSDLHISPGGNVPVTGAAQIEVTRQHATNSGGQQASGNGAIGVSASADLRIGKSGGVQGFLEPSITLDPTATRPLSVSGFAGVLIPLP